MKNGQKITEEKKKLKTRQPIQTNLSFKITLLNIFKSLRKLVRPYLRPINQVTAAEREDVFVTLIYDLSDVNIGQ